jgi:hypothetical protein
LSIFIAPPSLSATEFFVVSVFVTVVGVLWKSPGRNWHGELELHCDWLVVLQPANSWMNGKATHHSKTFFFMTNLNAQWATGENRPIVLIGE